MRLIGSNVIPPRFFEDSLNSSTICNIALGSSNVYLLTHIISIESQKKGVAFPDNHKGSIGQGLQKILAYMQANHCNYQHDINELKRELKYYLKFKFLGNRFKKQQIKSDIFDWYQALLAKVNTINK